jgi:hypothetical protein
VRLTDRSQGGRDGTEDHRGGQDGLGAHRLRHADQVVLRAEVDWI